MLKCASVVVLINFKFSQIVTSKMVAMDLCFKMVAMDLYERDICNVFSVLIEFEL